MYDLARDPDERENLLDVRNGEPRRHGGGAAKADLAERLDVVMDEAGTGM